MTRMMNDILSFSNVSLENFNPRLVSIEKVVNEVKQLLVTELKSSNAKIVSGQLPEIIVDLIQFKQLLKNIFENSLKFKGESNLLIELDVEEMANHYLFMVKDNGIGISKAYRESIFDIFGKVKEADKVNEAGVKLAVCKKIISNHKGKIWIESNSSGQGNVFCFTIPSNKVNEDSPKENLKIGGFQPALTFRKLKLNM